MTEHALTDERQWEQYKLLVEEYRFQVELNWKRSQYFLVLNVAVLVAAVGLLTGSSPRPKILVGAVFVLGGLLAILSLLGQPRPAGLLPKGP